MERDPHEVDGGRDVGRDAERDFGDEPPPLIRDAPPDYFAPIDESSPVSGHVPAPDHPASIAEAPEHDWGHAAGLIYPALRPVGTQGLRDIAPRGRIQAFDAALPASPAERDTGLPATVRALRDAAFTVSASSWHGFPFDLRLRRFVAVSASSCTEPKPIASPYGCSRTPQRASWRALSRRTV